MKVIWINTQCYWRTGRVVRVEGGLHADRGGGGYWDGHLVVGVYHPVGQGEGGVAGGGQT